MTLFIGLDDNQPIAPPPAERYVHTDATMFSLSLIVIPVLLSLVLHILLFDPISRARASRIPNAHFTSAFSSLWILWKRYKEQENRAIHAAHVKHGDIVRLGPNEVSVACVDEGIRTVYR